MTIKTKTEIVHMDMEGAWLTWMLRHLWAEGNEHKAVKLWQSAFPEHSTLDIIKEGFFIQLVTGQRKFVGLASEGFQLVKDKRKFWDPDQSGIDNKSFPLLDSWEDVIRLKQDKLYISELEMLTFRSTRRFGFGLEDNGNNAFNYLMGADENAVDNSITHSFTEVYNQLTEISKSLCMNPALLTLSETEIKFPVNMKGSSRWAKNFFDNKKCYAMLSEWVQREQFYFQTKYENKMFYVNDQQIRWICRIGEAEKRGMDIEKYKPTDDNFVAPENIKYSPEPSLLDNYISDIIKTNENKEFKPENIKTTKATNGYIDTDGNFYAVGFIQHINNDEQFVNQFHLEEQGNEGTVDFQRIIEQNGWIKVSQQRFYWDMLLHKITKTQIVTVAKLMKKWEMEITEFSGSFSRESLDDAIQRNKDDFELGTRMRQTR